MSRASPSSSRSHAPGRRIAPAAARTASATSRASPPRTRRSAESAAANASRYVSRASGAIERLQSLGRLEQERRARRRRASTANVDLRVQQLRARAGRARPAVPPAPSPAAAAPPPAHRPGACSGPRRARVAHGAAGSGVNSAARSRKAAPAARPPRACARSAERSSSAATSSSSPAVACARCHARRSGSAYRHPGLRQGPMDVAALLRRRPRCRPPSARADGGSAPGRRAQPDRPPPPGRRSPPNPSRPPRATRPADHPRARRPRRAAAAGVAAGSGVRRARKLSSMRPDNAGASANPNPPASSSGVQPRDISSNASGLPRVSATMPVADALVERTGEHGVQQRACVGVAQAVDDELREPVELRIVGRLAHGEDHATALPPAGAQRRRAPAPRRRSSHWASSTTHTSGCSSATSENRLRTARPTRKRSGAFPSRSPNAVPSASRCGSGSRSRRIQERRAELMQARECELHLRLHPRRARDAAARCALACR